MASNSTSSPANTATGTNTNTHNASSTSGGGRDRDSGGGSSLLNNHGTRRSGGGAGSGPGGGSSGREYCLRWNNHQPNLVSFFTELLGNESFVDVTLVSSEGRRIMAHKLVLSACSPYFQHVFENNPCKHPVVILKDVQYSDLRTIISFIYNGEVNISQDRINSILATAGTLKVKGLAEVPADELKRVGGNKNSESSSSRHQHQVPPFQSSSSWGSEDRDELPRKKLKKSSSATGVAGSSTNGEHSSGGSFESGVGASVSRSIDDGGMASEVGNVSSPASRPAPPPLTAATQPKSRSLDTGLQEGPHGDSELSSGGFSENQNYDESSLGGERGYDLEVADLKIDPVSDDGELDFDEDDNVYGADGDDNADYCGGDSSSNSYLNMSASSSASYFHQQSGLQFGPSLKGRRGPLLRQPRIKREGFDPARDVHDLEATESSGGSDINEEVNSQRKQQHSIPIVTLSTSSPTPPSSPLHVVTQEVSIPIITTEPSLASTLFPVSLSTIEPPTVITVTTSASAPTHLTIPTPATAERGHLVKQISQPLLPSSISTESTSTHSNRIQRQHSSPVPGYPSASFSSSRIITPSGLKAGTFYQLVPTSSAESFGKTDQENTYLLDSTSAELIQIISGPERVLPSSSIESRFTFTKVPHSGTKEVEVFKSAPMPSSSSIEEPSGDSFSTSMEEDTSSTSTVGKTQRSHTHCPALRPGPALGCNFCWNSIDSCGRILRRKTKYACPDCKINLCIVPCFQEYHEKKEKKKTKKLMLPKPSSM